jgi:molybdenum cofactor synthesis domain-containing protein
MTTPIAALLIVGNEILSGGTQDANLAFIAKRLSARGIPLAEVRVVRDVEAEIVEALNALRARYTYVFTTGGIGPTHDDITAPCVARAFGLPLEVNAEARTRLEAYYKPRNIELNAARLRMATIPKGAGLIDNPVSAAPGFRCGNVFVMAGVPRIMNAMFDHVETLIEGGTPLLSVTLGCNLKEGDIAAELAAIQVEFPGVDVGSYPSFISTPSLRFTLRSADAAALKAAAARTAAMIRSHGEEPLEQ